MGMTVTFEGAAELAAALLELPKRATEKAVVTRGLKLAAEPTRGLWSALVPVGPNVPPHWHYREDVIVSTKTIARKGNPAAAPGDVTVYIGPSKLLYQHHGIMLEFGTFKDRPQPSGRPAWAATRDQAFNQLGLFIWQQIDLTAHRLAVRAAR